MKSAKAVVVMAAVGLAACCTVPDMISLNALYEESNVVFDPALLGEWRMDDDVIRIEQSGENGYRIHSIEKQSDDDDLYFKLARIGGVLFVDISEQDKLGHQFGKIAIQGDRIQVALIRAGWLREKVVEEGQLSFKNVSHADCSVSVITASTRELQFFLLRYASVPEAFEDPFEMVRSR